MTDRMSKYCVRVETYTCRFDKHVKQYTFVSLSNMCYISSPKLRLEETYHNTQLGLVSGRVALTLTGLIH